MVVRGLDVEKQLRVVLAPRASAILRDPTFSCDVRCAGLISHKGISSRYTEFLYYTSALIYLSFSFAVGLGSVTVIEFLTETAVHYHPFIFS